MMLKDNQMVDYQTYENYVADKDDSAPASTFLSDKMYDKIVRKVIR
jgi:hypothetical protein